MCCGEVKAMKIPLVYNLNQLAVIQMFTNQQTIKDQDDCSHAVAMHLHEPCGYTFTIELILIQWTVNEIEDSRLKFQFYGLFQHHKQDFIKFQIKVLLVTFYLMSVQLEQDCNCGVSN